MARTGTADVVLGEYSGAAWLVRGEQHIDDLLGNTLSDHVSIEIIACESKSEVEDIWRFHGGGADEFDQMWMIHPAIVERTRGFITGVTGGPPGVLAVSFGGWSAALDDAGLEVIRHVAEAAREKPEAVLVLARYVVPGGAPLLADLANLRSGRVEAALQALGIDAERMLRQTRPPAAADDADRIVLTVR